MTESPQKRTRSRYFGRSRLLIVLSVLRIVASLTLLACVWFVIDVFQQRDRTSAAIALGLIILFGALRVFIFTQARHLRCPLCHGTILHSNAAHKHKHAMRIPVIGHGWAVIINALIRGKFRCMYCGTSFRTKK
ncbi:hypothetical protein FEM03_02840 [Phragmitibacter flavus]|uniref:Uncharacterized protein n=1 Tax=Phragmitibacter flavus TaxID=2576071 RepID=A0A5R8KJ75_9BACT|nr:hypothetical protein [Phragmitibacter flavus]TLD72307.1 hypothetical protein FEM03_02840 [Phragmitibacter flavus]